MRSVLPIACLSLAACSRQDTPAAEVDLNAAAVQAQEDIDNYAVSHPARRPAGRTAVKQQGTASMPETAPAVVTRYFALLGVRRFAAAWDLWSHQGAGCGRSEAQFAASFTGLTALTAKVGAEQDADSGAGQRYVKVPASLHLVRQGGGAVEAKVMVTLHRVADGIDTIDPTDHQWRLSAQSVDTAAGSGPPAPDGVLTPCREAG